MRRSFSTAISTVLEQESVRVLQLNRASAFNTLDLESTGELRRLLAMWATNDAVAGVVLQGSGGAFCGGADMDWLANNRAKAPELYGALRGLYVAVAEYPKPLVALLNGDVNGAGLGLANTGRRVALASARFSIPEARVGLVPDGPVLAMLATADARLDLPLTNYLSLTGAAVDADGMMHMGLATHLIPDSTSAEELVRYLAAFPPGVSAQEVDDALGLFCEWQTDPNLVRVASEVATALGAARPVVDTFPWSEDESAAMVQCFGKAASVEETWALLEARGAAGCAWSTGALAGLREAPALSLLATARLARESRDLTPAQVCALSAQVAARLAQDAEVFEEMVRHDRAGTSAPLTTLGDLKDVPRDELDALFEP